jgi:Holliday junction resolvasome RuvABC DNA-binding subunit
LTIFPAGTEIRSVSPQGGSPATAAVTPASAITLGVSPETLKAAIQKVREEKSFKHDGAGDHFTEALATELGVEPAKVTEAWQAAQQKAKESLAAQRDAWVGALATQLGIDKAKMAAALHDCGGANRFARGH